MLDDSKAMRTVLVVEDDLNDLDFIKRAFKITFFARKVIHCPHGPDALDYLFSRGVHFGRPEGQPEIIFLDLNLPGMPGLEVLKQIRSDQLTQHITIVVMTASSEEEAIVSCYNQGANFFLRKRTDNALFNYEVLQLELHWLSRGGPK
jgi:CheY-like chemotaxis protein